MGNPIRGLNSDVVYTFDQIVEFLSEDGLRYSNFCVYVESPFVTLTPQTHCILKQVDPYDELDDLEFHLTKEVKYEAIITLDELIQVFIVHKESHERIIIEEFVKAVEYYMSNDAFLD